MHFTNIKVESSTFSWVVKRFFEAANRSLTKQSHSKEIYFFRQRLGSCFSIPEANVKCFQKLPYFTVQNGQRLICDNRILHCNWSFDFNYRRSSIFHFKCTGALGFLTLRSGREQCAKILVCFDIYFSGFFRTVYRSGCQFLTFLLLKKYDVIEIILINT